MNSNSRRRSLIYSTTNRYVVAVVKDDKIIGHLPQKVSKICSLFLKRVGSIVCTVIGNRRYSSDLQQRGLKFARCLHHTVALQLCWHTKSQTLESLSPAYLQLHLEAGVDSLCLEDARAHGYC